MSPTASSRWKTAGSSQRRSGFSLTPVSILDRRLPSSFGPQPWTICRGSLDRGMLRELQPVSSRREPFPRRHDFPGDFTMRPTRRCFLGTAFGAGTLLAARPAKSDEDLRATYEKIDQAAAAPILNAELWPKPVKIASMELLAQPAQLPGPGADDRRRRGDRRAQRDAPRPHLPDLRQSRRPVLRRQGRPRSSSPCSGSFTGTTTTTSTRGWPSGSAWRPPSSRSSTCSAS